VINDRKVPGGAGDDGKKKKGGCCWTSPTHQPILSKWAYYYIMSARAELSDFADKKLYKL
jgi:hypothetical protein